MKAWTAHAAGNRPMKTFWMACLLASAAALWPGVSTSAGAARPPDGRQLRPPAHWERGVFMEIFVRAYQDSDGDGVGDLRGLISRLDYLQALGIRGIWLMPIQKNADGDHGYATTDYRAVDPAYGTLADFDELIRQAHRRGIGVIVDYVVNHSAAEHPFFVQARSNPASPYRRWYVWSDQMPAGWDIWGKNPWYHAGSRPWLFPGEPKDLPAPPAGARDFYFGTFGPHMPDFDLRREEVVQYHLRSLRFWLDRGLAGYRLDAVPHMIENSAKDWNDQPESRRLSKRLQDTIRAYPGRVVVCEATAEPQAYGDPAVCGGAFAFGFVHHYVQAARGDPRSVAALAEYWKRASPTMATFVSNHDRFAGARLWDQVGGDVAAYKVAAAGYLLQPGTPYIYYGEEVGMGGVNHLESDLPLRSPMSWTGDPARAGFTTGTPFRPIAPNVAGQNAQAQAADPQSILAFYKAMIGLRNTYPSIARGRFEHGFADGLVLGFQRALGAERTLVLIHYGTEPATAWVRDLPAGARLEAAYPAAGAASASGASGPAAAAPRADAQGTLAIEMPAQSVRVFRVRAGAQVAGR
jgi:glycosidase